MNDLRLLDRTFRTSGRFELRVFDQLAAGERQELAELTTDPSFYGLLCPTSAAGARGAKAVDRDTALLLYTLHQPGPIPAYARRPRPADAARAVARLVLDGILDVALGDAWVSGANAYELLTSTPAGSPANTLARRSRAALDGAACLGLMDPAQATAWLYGYGREPETPSLARRFGDPKSLREQLGLLSQAQAGAAFRAFQPAVEREGWLYCERRDLPAVGATAPAAVTFKLYLSPPARDLGAWLAPFAEVAGRGRATAFKVGADLAGLLRPDKAVAYFTSFDHLAEVAHELETRLAGAPAHGVPFTAEIGNTGGLLSWGIDPPALEALLGQRASWRLWVTQQLGAALAATLSDGTDGAHHSHHTHHAARAALERLRLEGVDIERWTPDLSRWTQSARGAHS